jgi:glucose-1-phosphate cytidylyltransferase
MRHYAHFGFRQFVIGLGYKGDIIKKFMIDYASLSSNLTINLGTGDVQLDGGYRPDWMVELIDTGIKTQTGGRIKRLQSHPGEGTFMMTWGDGVSDINLLDLLAFHKSHGKLATMTAVRPPARFGHIEFEGQGGQITQFDEKPQTSEGWINGAFFVLEPGIFDYIEGDADQWERSPLQRLTADGQLMAYRHEAFWQCMDTLRDKRLLEKLWEGGSAPWKLWA